MTMASEHNFYRYDVLKLSYDCFFFEMKFVGNGNGIFYLVMETLQNFKHATDVWWWIQAFSSVPQQQILE